MLGSILISPDAGLRMAEQWVSDPQARVEQPPDIDFSDLLSLDETSPQSDGAGLVAPVVSIPTLVLPSPVAPILVSDPAPLVVEDKPPVSDPEPSAEPETFVDKVTPVGLATGELPEPVTGEIRATLATTAGNLTFFTDRSVEETSTLTTTERVVPDAALPQRNWVSGPVVANPIAASSPKQGSQSRALTEATSSAGVGLGFAMDKEQGQPEDPLTPKEFAGSTLIAAAIKVGVPAGQSASLPWQSSSGQLGDVVSDAVDVGRPSGPPENAEVETMVLPIVALPDRVMAGRPQSPRHFPGDQPEQGLIITSPSLAGRPKEDSTLETKWSTAPRSYKPEALDVPPEPSVEASLPESDGAAIDWESPPLPMAYSNGSVGATTTSTGVSTPAANLAQLAAQMVDSLTKGPDGTATLTLSPEELGQVRLTFQPDGQNLDRIVLMLAFDRPDTQDLFRRHADQLTEALRSAGYTGVQLDFGSTGDQTSGHKLRDKGAESASLTAAPAGGESVSNATRGNPGGTATLDLRL